MLFEDRKLLLACIGGSVITYNLFRAAKSFYDSSRRSQEWIPIGTVKSLTIFPIKSCRGREVFSLHCGQLGVSFRELIDREFIAIDGATGKLWRALQVPKLFLIEPDVTDGVLTVSVPNGEKLSVNLGDVIKRNDVRRTTQLENLQCDGLDCGDEIAKFFSEFTGTPGMRVIMYRPNLFNGRTCVTKQEWWNNPVPKRKDTVTYVNLAPYMITTEPSLEALNEKLDKKITSTNFRASIVVDKCAPWDEDRWSDIKIGDAELQCYKPCTRCMMTTMDQQTGAKDANMMKKLREFRLAPPGKLRAAHGDSPIFGVNAGLVRPGYIHVGQTVYAKYKPSEF